MSYGVDRRHCLNPELWWLWRRLAATALIQPLAGEPPYAIGASLKRQKDKKTKQNTHTHKTQSPLNPVLHRLSRVVPGWWAFLFSIMFLHPLTKRER